MTARLTFAPTISRNRAVLDVSGTKKDAAEAMAAAAQLLAGRTDGLGGKMALQSAKMQLNALLRRTGPGGHVLVWEAGNRDRGGQGAAVLLAEMHPTSEHVLQTPADLKARLQGRIAGAAVQYLEHPAIGFGGRVVGTAKELNENVHVLYYGFIDPTQQHIIEFEATSDAEEHEPFTSEESDAIAEIIKGCSLTSE